MATKTAPIRRGVPVCFTIDVDAEPILRAMVPNGKGIGAFLSELIRREARERTQRPALLAALRPEGTPALAAAAAATRGADGEAV
jgi:hypothetical protein